MPSQPARAIINNRYQLLEPLGAGGMGVVFRTRDRLTNREIALKRVTIPPNELLFASRADTSEHSLALAKEFRTLATLRHPHIVSVLDYGFDAGRIPFFTMDLLVNAQTVVEAAVAQPVEVKVNLLLQMLQALAYLHRRGILHRDLKPANVLVVPERNGPGQVKLLDFGLSVVTDKSEAALGNEMAGTLAYMAPELFQGLPPSRGADLYAVGMIAYEMLAGRYPFDKGAMAKMMMSIISQQPDFSALGDNADLIAVVRRLLAKTRQARYRSAPSVIRDLCAAAALPLPAETIAIRESFLQAATFVGRQTEMDTLNAALNQAQQGPGSVWLIGGESGAGKSRLLEEFRIQAMVSGWQVFRGQAVSDGGSPYELWQEIVPQLALNTALTGLESSVLRQMAPRIDQVVDDPLPPLPELGDEAEQQRLLLTFIDVLQRQDKPTLLLLEDLQWSDESLAPLKQILRVLDRLPGVMVLGTYRRDERPDLPTELPGAQMLPLGNLRDEEVAELSQAMLGGEVARREELITLLQRETEGNAFFLVEVVRALAEEAGKLNRVPGMALPTAQILTGGMAQLVRRRLDKVPAHHRPLLQLAAVAGRAVDPILLEQLAGTSLDAWLGACEEAAVLVVQENRWQFAHDKLREVLVADMTAPERRNSHRQVAEAIEISYPDEPARAGVLAQHWRGAKNELKEAHYALIAGQQAVDSFAHAEGLAFLNRALQLLPDAGAAQRYEIVRARERLFHNLGEREAQQADLHRLVALARELGVAEEAAVALRQAEYSQVTSAFDAAIAQAHEAIEKGRQTANQSLIAKAYWVRGMAWQQKGRYAQAIEQFGEGLQLARAAGDRKLEAYCLDGLGFVSAFQAEIEAAIDYHQAALKILREIGDRWSEAVVLGNLAGALGEAEEYAAAHAHYEQGLAIKREFGDRYEEGLFLNDIGYFLERQGDYETATSYIEQALAINREIGNRWGEGYAVSNLGLINLNQGRYEEAQGYFQDSLAISRDIDNLENVVFSITGLGQAALDQGNLELAETYFQQVAALDAKQVRPYVLAELASELAQLHLARGQTDAAAQRTREVLAFLETNPRMDASPNRMRVFRQTWSALVALGEDAAAAQVLGLAARVIKDFLARNDDPDAREMYLNQPHHRVLWDAWRRRRFG